MRIEKLLTTAAMAATLAAGAAQAQTAEPPAAAPGEAAAPAESTAPPAAETPKVVANGDIVTTAQLSGQFKTFLKAAEATNLLGLLKQTQNITVFAPTDAAFAALPPGELDKLMLPENKPQLQKLVIHHIVNARLDSSKFVGAKGPVPTVAGDNIEIDGSGDHVMVGPADVVQADVMASNGIVHVIDKVLIQGAPAAATSGADASDTAQDAQSEEPAAEPS